MILVEKTKRTLLKKKVLPYTRLLIFKNIMPPKQENDNDKKGKVKDSEEDRTYYTVTIETYKTNPETASTAATKVRETIVFIWPKKSIMFMPENIEILPTRSVLFGSEPDTGMKVRIALFKICYPKPVVDDVEKIIMKLFKRKENI